MQDLPNVYDDLCNRIDRYVGQLDPCKIHIDKNGKTACISKMNCCDGCKYLGSNGCTTSCLGCKLFICYTVQKKYPELRAFLNTIKFIAKRYNFVKVRTSREDILS